MIIHILLVIQDNKGHVASLTVLPEEGCMTKYTKIGKKSGLLFSE